MREKREESGVVGCDGGRRLRNNIGSGDGVLHWDVGLPKKKSMTADTNAEDVHDDMEDEEEVITLQPGQQDAFVNSGHIRGRKQLLDGKWHHVAMTYDHMTSHVAFFVDGWQEGAAKIAGDNGDAPGAKIKLGFTNVD